ncbi:MAG TPA: HPr family phosphocarrier protein [Gemmatimonadales bacterium]|nr:HPr family phosphocarrier protein [Gemmatimonadales bacterium]
MSVTREVQIVNPLGLHARPAAQLVKLASQYASEVTLTRDGMPVNAKSIMGVMMLSAEQGATVQVAATGPDAEAAVAAIAGLVAAGFGEL